MSVDEPCRRKAARDRAMAVLDAFYDANDEDYSTTDLEQISVMLEAFQIFVQRNAKRHDLWKQFGWEDSALHIRSKAARVGLTLDPAVDLDPDDVLDDALDLINVAVFFVRNVRGV